MATAPALSPGSIGFDDATASVSLLRTPRPRRVVVARDVRSVQEAVRTAVDAELRVAAFTTGHGAGRLGTLDDALLIRVVLDGPVVIDAVRGTARVPAGALWRDVVVEAARHGLLAPHGSSGTVGAVGYLVNGGLGFTARAIGVASNSVLAVEYVGADGEPHRTDADEQPERFWALRGGGGGIGVVTAVEVRLRPGASVLTGARVYGPEHAGDLLRVWRDWCADAPRSITTTARILNLPPLPPVPPVLTGGPVVAIDGIALADEHGREAATALLDRLDALADPLLDTWHVGGAADALTTHMDPEDPAPAWTTHDLLGELSDEAIDLVVAAGTGPTPLLVHELRQLGGAVAEPDEPGGFFDRVPEPFLFNGVAIAPEPAALRAAQAHAAALRERLAAVIAERCVPTFLESADDGRLAASADAMARLRRARVDADPFGRFAVRP